MITLTRRQARRLRGVFRRSALGIAHRGPIPPLVLRAEGGQLRAQTSVRATWPSSTSSPGLAARPASVALPLDALADFEGRDESPVALEAARPRPDRRPLGRPRHPPGPRVRRPRDRHAGRRSPSRPRVVRGPGRAARRPGRGDRHRRRGRHAATP